LSLDPPKKDLKLAGPGPNFRKSRVRVQKNKPGPKDPGPDPGTRHIPSVYYILTVYPINVYMYTIYIHSWKFFQHFSYSNTDHLISNIPISIRLINNLRYVSAFSWFSCNNYSIPKLFLSHMLCKTTVIINDIFLHIFPASYFKKKLYENLGLFCFFRCFTPPLKVWPWECLIRAMPHTCA